LIETPVSSTCGGARVVGQVVSQRVRGVSSVPPAPRYMRAHIVAVMGRWQRALVKAVAAPGARAPTVLAILRMELGREPNEVESVDARRAARQLAARGELRIGYTRDYPARRRALCVRPLDGPEYSGIAPRWGRR